MKKLFHVLVVLGGASAVAGCGEDNVERDRGPDAASDDDAIDAAPGAPDASPASDDGGTSDLTPCFCDTSACCDRSGETPVVQDGFECCWSTVCE
jgi:hypothetical protein